MQRSPSQQLLLLPPQSQGATAPFTLMHAPTRASSKAQDESSLEERIPQLTETLY